ncbi:NADPH-dependent FMN reductase [Pleomorphomonas sp. T1.2MG-36]|uniref:NADPH-dependent FMN reductase n=1 Tax=Pleomorphomonas sp. T1.2MG-36 TaxID=3041167 RepID=UPI0025404743|nr:NAD(P)H-dependent oxidoreductase [Pleomorphomonas sp. T1.2MG-36]
MSKIYSVAVLVGSLRKGAYTRMLANALKKIAPPSIALSIVEIGDLPLYNPDLDDAGAPAAWTRFRNEVKSSNAVLFITPEYNRSVPAALKNALDVGSRPYGASVWPGKPGAIISLTPGSLGAFGANHHLRQSLVFLDVPTLQQPEAYLGNAGSMFDVAGGFADASTEAHMKAYLDAFADWITRTAKA